MKTYLIHLSPQSGLVGCFRVTYTDDHLMKSIENLTNISTESDLFSRLSKIPLSDIHLPALKQKGIRIDLVPDNLTFEHFWNSYGNKVGDKKRTQKLWDNLPDSDRVAALAKIKAYDIWLSKNTIAKVYPETYLSQRRWENDFGQKTTLFG